MFISRKDKNQSHDPPKGNGNKRWWGKRTLEIRVKENQGEKHDLHCMCWSINGYDRKDMWNPLGEN